MWDHDVPAVADIQLECDISAPGGRQSRRETTLLAHQPVLWICCVLNEPQQLTEGERMQPVRDWMHAPGGRTLYQKAQMCRQRDRLKPGLAACRPPSLWAICHMRMTL